MNRALINCDGRETCRGLLTSVQDAWILTLLNPIAGEKTG
jgi:hypothetical protein